MDQTKLQKDFGLFSTVFAEDYIGSSEDVKMSYMQPKNGQKSTTKRFFIFLTFFAEDYTGSSEDVKNVIRAT